MCCLSTCSHLRHHRRRNLCVVSAPPTPLLLAVALLRPPLFYSFFSRPSAHCCLFFFFLMIRRPPKSPLFPYPTLSQSCPRPRGRRCNTPAAALPVVQGEASRTSRLRHRSAPRRFRGKTGRFFADRRRRTPSLRRSARTA